MSVDLFNLPFEPIERNIDIIDSFTLRHVIVSLFISTECDDNLVYTSKIMLFDSFNRAYESSNTYCHYKPMTVASYWKHILNISSLSLRNKVNYKINKVSDDKKWGLFKAFSFYTEDMDTNTITFTLCPQLCKKNITPAALLRKMEEEYYPYMVTGLK